MMSVYHEVYDRVYSERNVDEDVRQLISTIRSGQGQSALDFGCGTGLYTAALQPYFERVSGYDIDTESETRFRQNAPRAQFLKALPAAEAFDAIFAFFNVFNYIVPGSTALAQAQRLANLARPGAWLVLDILRSTSMVPGNRSNEIQVNLSGRPVTYRQSMTLGEDRSMEFLETVAESTGRSHARKHELWLWQEDELAKVLVAAGFSYQGPLSSPFLRPNQIRLAFRRAA